jgi:UPF0755 protein
MFRFLLKLVAVIILAAGAWLAYALLLPIKPREPKFVLLHPGWSTRRIARELKNAGVIRSADAFLIVHYADARKVLKAGEYKFDQPANALEVRRRLSNGDIYTHTVVVPEGYNMFDIARTVEEAGLGSAADFLKIAREQTVLVRNIDPNAASLEGYLFPDTYQFTRTQSMNDIVAAMVHRFTRESTALALTGDIHKIVTMAAIVEKETSVPEERPVVASVYYNRLARNMPLAADPTVVYASVLDGRYRGTIYQSDLQSASPYNTYKFPGLPPGPIANPGRESLKAAMNPAQTNFLYFVAEGNTGHHKFSSTYEEHQRNVLAYRRATGGSH